MQTTCLFLQFKFVYCSISAASFISVIISFNIDLIVTHTGSTNVNARDISYKMFEHLCGLISRDLSIDLCLIQVLIHVSRCKPTFAYTTDYGQRQPLTYVLYFMFTVYK
jgi:hypothetical protein